MSDVVEAEVKTAKNESVFSFDELFFSRTDKKGIIQTGNSVFQRVAKYEWNELLKKPHSLIRHSTMPRAVFHLLWETILADNPVGAYVVNRAKDGSFYWVYALVFPLQDGFLSVRLKPSSAIFEIIKKKYEELLSLERSKKLSPKESQEVLLQELKNLNFHSYRAFMTEALTNEIECRQKKMGADPLPIVSELRMVLDLAVKLQRKCDEIFCSYQMTALVPLNLEVQAARIGEEAAPIAVVSAQYDQVAKQIQIETQKFVEAGTLVQAKVHDCQFDICATILQIEMVYFFKDETQETPIDKQHEMNLLEALAKKGIERTKQSLEAIETEFFRFNGLYQEVKKLSIALEIIALTGKIEAAKLRQSSIELLALLGDLGKFKETLKVSLQDIDAIGKDLIFHTKEMQQEISLPPKQ